MGSRSSWWPCSSWRSLIGVRHRRACSPRWAWTSQGGVSVILHGARGHDLATSWTRRSRTSATGWTPSGWGSPTSRSRATRSRCRSPAVTNGTIEERQKEQYCLVDDAGVNYGCGADQAEAQAALDDLQVTSQASEACVEDADGTQLECFTSEQEATAFQSSITVAAKTAASPSASPSGSASPSASPSSEPDTGGFCLTDPTGKQYGCSTTKKEAQKVVDGLTVEVTKHSYCVTGGATATESEASPTPSATPDPSKSASPSPSASASPSASPSPSGVSGLDLQGTETASVRARHEGRRAGCARCDRGVQADRAVLRDQLGRQEPGLLHRPGRRRAGASRDGPAAPVERDRTDRPVGAAARARDRPAVGPHVHVVGGDLSHGRGGGHRRLLVRHAGPARGRLHGRPEEQVPPGTDRDQRQRHHEGDRRLRRRAASPSGRSRSSSGATRSTRSPRPPPRR